MTHTQVPPAPEANAQDSSRTILLSPRNIWRVGFAVLGVVAVALLLRFLIDDGGGVIFTVLMSWFAAIAMAPAVDRLARHMPRGLATLVTMLAVLLAGALFVLAFGSLLVDQIGQVIAALPALIDNTLKWINETFGLTLDIEQIKQSMNITSEKATALAAQLGTQALSIIGSALGAVFSLFTFGLFTFYLSADGRRLRRWVAALFPARAQGVVVNVWDITAAKTGGYIGARVVLAVINSVTTGIVFLAIGMPYWLALAIWTGVVAQFVPTIGTYIAIILPVIVGLLSPTPWVGVAALVWALLYQQVENLTIEPKISAKAVNVHPAVAFGSVMLGAALFGVAGAFLAVPVTAMLLALLDIYVKRHELIPELREGDLGKRKFGRPKSGKGGAVVPTSGADDA